MSWNEPDKDKGDRNDNNGWDNGPRGGKDQGPPDLDEAIASLIRKLSGLFGGKGGGKGAGGTGSGGLGSGLFIAILVIIGIFWVGSGFYTVDESERGVVLRFGRALDGVVLPGLHWNPKFVDEVHRVNVTRVFTENFSNSMLTEDDNIIDVTMSVQFQATDARSFFLNVRDPVLSLQHAAESAIRHEIGSSEMETAMTSGREVISQQVLERLQSYMDLYQTGITVTRVNIAEVQQPAPVRAAYDDVIKAGEDRIAYQNEARAYANQVIPEARGRALRLEEEAIAYRDELIARAEGEAQRFKLLLTEYRKAPEVTRKRLYLDTMQAVLSNNAKVMVDVEGSNNMLYLPLDRIMEQRQNNPQNSGNVSSFSGSDIRSLSDQVIRDLQSRQSTTTNTTRSSRQP